MLAYLCTMQCWPLSPPPFFWSLLLLFAVSTACFLSFPITIPLCVGTQAVLVTLRILAIFDIIILKYYIFRKVHLKNWNEWCRAGEWQPLYWAVLKEFVTECDFFEIPCVLFATEQGPKYGGKLWLHHRKIPSHRWEVRKPGFICWCGRLQPNCHCNESTNCKQPENYVNKLISLQREKHVNIKL